MCLNQEPLKPVLVNIPGTNRFINIAPYFYYLEQYCQGKPEQLNERIESLIRFVSLFHDTEETDSLELKNNLGALFSLKDMFANMQEFKN